MAYDPEPHYPPVGGEVVAGWSEAASSLPPGEIVLAVDGPAVLNWAAVAAGLTQAFRDRGVKVELVDIGTQYAPWEHVCARTSTSELAQDPDFAKVAEGSLLLLFDRPPELEAHSGSARVVFGPGASLVPHDILWYADLPKRFAERAVSTGSGKNLGQRGNADGATLRRLFYIDWPLLDRHRDAIAAKLDRYIDTQDPARPRSIDGTTLRRTAAALSLRPFRTRPTFNSTPWGGHWAQRELRMSLDALNSALGYELIAPEAGVLVGQGLDLVEVPFQVVVALAPREVLGDRAHRQFGTSFPIRFDYLDTLDGGNLSVHCHPRSDYMRDVFGWPYTQHETYYMMVGGPGRRVFLGLRGDADIARFHQDAAQANLHGRPFDVETYVQSHRAEPHKLFTIPAGTPHGSGEGNVVLEVSATPYLYSLRLYDWLRQSLDGTLRPVHVEHAFANLDTSRVGQRVVTDLTRAPRLLRAGIGWCEELLSHLPEMFFEVRRLVIHGADSVADRTAGTFHVINMVEGNGVVVRTDSGEHALSYAETLVIPAAVGSYWIDRQGSARTRVVKALIS